MFLQMNEHSQTCYCLDNEKKLNLYTPQIMEGNQLA